eukprot:gene12809-biopygen55
MRIGEAKNPGPGVGGEMPLQLNSDHKCGKCCVARRQWSAHYTSFHAGTPAPSFTETPAPQPPEAKANAPGGVPDAGAAGVADIAAALHKVRRNDDDGDAMTEPGSDVEDDYGEFCVPCDDGDGARAAT